MRILPKVVLLPRVVENTGEYFKLLSGVFYPKVPSNSGDICFISSQDTWIDSNTEPKVTGFDDLNSRKKTFTPRQGMLLMFPAHLRHYVTASKSDDERLSISFDYNLN